MRKFDIWDVIIWISFLVLIGYIIAKLAGLINTPDWINLIPLITLAFFGGAFYQKVLGFMNLMSNRTDYFKKQIDKINYKLNEHDKRIFNLEHSRSKK